MKRKFLAIILCLVINAPIYPMVLDQATYTVGKRFFEQGLYTEAEPRFLDIVRKYPDSPHYYSSLFYLGQTYAHLGKYKPALQYYKILLNKSKTVAEKQKALLGISKSWLQLGIHDKAGDFYAFFATEYPESEYASAALYFSGIARERENRVSAAIEKYRTVLELYPESDYYAKSIEKVAVLDSTTPESLWADTQVPNNIVAKKGSIDMFVNDIGDEENVDFDDPRFITRNQTTKPNNNQQNNRELIDDTDFEKTDFKAQLSSSDKSVSNTMNPVLYQNRPTVLTQFIQSPPQIITQKIVEVITQQMESIQSELPEPINSSYIEQENDNEIQRIIQENVVQKIGDQYIPLESGKDYDKKQTIAAYKKLWEEEYQLNLKEQELENTKLKVKELAQLSTEKAQILQVKEDLLKEQQSRIQNNIYQDLSEKITKDGVQQFTGPPLFTQGENPPSNIPSLPPSPAPPIVAEETTYNEEYTAEDDAYGGEDEYAIADDAYGGDEGYATDDGAYNEEYIADDA